MAQETDLQEVRVEKDNVFNLELAVISGLSLIAEESQESDRPRASFASGLKTQLMFSKIPLNNLTTDLQDFGPAEKALILAGLEAVVHKLMEESK